MSAPGPVEWIAHRGESADAPENTLAAFELAWERGVGAIELDVHLTADGQLAVCHDGNTLRTTGVDCEIAGSAMADLQTLDAGAWRGPRWVGQPIPTLPQALATMPPGAHCLIEVKSGPEAAPALRDAVAASGLGPAAITVISFDTGAVAASSRLLPGYPHYLLDYFRHDGATGAWSPGIDELVDLARSIGAGGLNLAAQEPVTPDLVRRAHERGLPVYVWTVDDPETARRLVAAGVDGITSNRAAWLRATAL